MGHKVKLHIAVIGSGAAGLSAAWLLSKRHKVTLLEKDQRLGGHAHTATIAADLKSYDSRHVTSSDIKIDTGFIVYNEPSYPNLTRWFADMGVATEASDMSFAVSRDNGNFEYAGGPPLGLLSQPSLVLKPTFWRMLKDLLRFYREAPGQIDDQCQLSLGEFLTAHRYNDDFVQYHLLPFGAAIWSTSMQSMLDYPAAAFIRFCDNHGLLQITGRPQWRTVTGGSDQYVQKVRQTLGPDGSLTGFNAVRVQRNSQGVVISDAEGHTIEADHVVFAAHADQTLAMIDQPTPEEQALLSPFGYEANHAWLHTDTRCMPRRRRAWCSWNYVETETTDINRVSVSYWMNRLQNIRSSTNYIVTLNPDTPPPADQVIRSEVYQHPVFTHDTWQAQQQLWSLQGQNRSWFCGSYFGSGFHEDAVQSGLAVAEQLGRVARPWSLDHPSPRIVVPSDRLAEFEQTEVLTT